MKKHFLKTIIVSAVIVLSLSLSAQTPVTPGIPGPPNGVGSTPNPSTPGYNNTNGGSVPGSSTPGTSGGGAVGVSGYSGPAGNTTIIAPTPVTNTGPASPNVPNNSIPQNVGKNDVYSPTTTPHREIQY